MTSQQQYSLKWNDYTSYITGAFDALRYEEDLVDVTLFCEGRKIRAHKVLLSACSTYFKDIFKENPCQHPVIIFKNVKYSDLLALVEFMYQGEVSVLQESLSSFLHTAELLSVRGLADNNGAVDQLHSTVPNHSLQTQTQGCTATAEQLYFTIPTNSTIIPQLKVESQPTNSIQPAQQFLNKITLKSADLSTAITLPIGQQTIQLQQAQQSQQPQQPQQQQQQQPQQQQPQQQQQQQQQQHHQQQQQVVQQQQKIQIKPLPPATSTVVQQTVVPNQANQNQGNQSSNALQELVESVVSTARSKKPKRIVKLKSSPVTITRQEVAETTTSGKTTTNYTTLAAGNTTGQTDNDMQIYDQAERDPEQGTSYGDSVTSENSEVKIQITEFIDVDDAVNACRIERASGTYAQERYELVNENSTERQESDEHMGQNSFEMEIVDMDMNNMFTDEVADELENKANILANVTRVKEEKRFKCKECDKSFATWKSLAMHRHIHSGRTKCTICGAVLSRTANLKRHMKLKHEP